MKAAFFSRNRERLGQKLSGSLVVLSAYTQLQRGNDAAFMFEQEANFWYMTGITHPDWKVVIDGASKKEWLIAPTVDTTHELFDGSLDWQEASQISGIANVVSSEDGAKLLRDIAKTRSMVYTIETPEHAAHFGFSLNPAILANKHMLDRVFSSVRSCQKELSGLRAIKQKDEIVAIKKAVKLTVAAFEKVKKSFASYEYEYAIEADFTHYFRSHGATGHAYDPIVAGGKNACTLHYNQNNAKTAKSGLVLMDIGARIDGYAADITRTYARGEISKRQHDIHQALEVAHHNIVRTVVPHMPVAEYSRAVDDIMKATLIELGLLKDASDQTTYRTYFPHAVSHGLGIDVHDSLAGSRTIEPGMVLTVEPGIYVPQERIGIRIEDDILVTEKGISNLSGSLSTSY